MTLPLRLDSWKEGSQHGKIQNQLHKMENESTLDFLTAKTPEVPLPPDDPAHEFSEGTSAPEETQNINIDIQNNTAKSKYTL